MSDSVRRWFKLSLLAATASLMLGSVAWGQSWNRYDDDYYNRRHDASEHGYRNGYRDGYQRGQYDGDRGHRFKFKNDDWEDSRGYQHWMGNKGRYKHEYREGYERGYREAYTPYGYRRDRDGYRWHDRDDLR